MRPDTWPQRYLIAKKGCRFDFHSLNSFSVILYIIFNFYLVKPILSPSQKVFTWSSIPWYSICILAWWQKGKIMKGVCFRFASWFFFFSFFHVFYSFFLLAFCLLFGGVYWRFHQRLHTLISFSRVFTRTKIYLNYNS